MSDQKPILPEAPEIAEVETKKGEARPEVNEAAEKGFESKKEKENTGEVAQVMREKIEQSKGGSSNAVKSQANSTDVEAKKEKIISKFAESVLAAGIDTPQAQKIIKEMEAKYLKNFPDIVDAAHDRITGERTRKGKN